MKLLRLSAILLITVTMFTSCDYVRKLLGKPTSKDLERMRTEQEAQLKKQKQIDSLERVKAAEIAKEQENAKANSGILDESAGRFHVVLGSFKVVSNADKMYARLEKMGYKPLRIAFKNNFDVVSIGSFGTYKEAYNEMVKLLMNYEWIPEDIWIYDIHQHLHK